jgi:type II secretory pathway pseudopilin PulG
MNRDKRQHNQKGMTYLLLLWWVAIGGVMLASMGASWRHDSQRQRELEYAFRGEQIVQAILSYHAATPMGQQAWPSSLDDLVEDRRGDRVIRHLRRLWSDPFTEKEWQVINTAEGIKGVYGTDNRRPLSGPEGVKSYSDWRFEVHGD